MHQITIDGIDLTVFMMAGKGKPHAQVSYAGEEWLYRMDQTTGSGEWVFVKADTLPSLKKIEAAISNEIKNII